MATRKTWFWIIGGVCGAGVFTLIAVAGTGVYLVSRHVQSESATSARALDAFETVSSSFPGKRPLFELDTQDRPHLTAALATLPTSPVKPSSLMIQAWDPEAERLVRVSLPFWLLRLGPDHMRVSKHDRGFDFSTLQLDVNELARIGPAIVLDYRNQDGVRVLLWTK